jgi:hypothetical protein
VLQSSPLTVSAGCRAGTKRPVTVCRLLAFLLGSLGVACNTWLKHNNVELAVETSAGGKRMFAERHLPRHPRARSPNLVLAGRKGRGRWGRGAQPTKQDQQCERLLVTSGRCPLLAGTPVTNFDFESQIGYVRDDTAGATPTILVFLGHRYDHCYTHERSSERVHPVLDPGSSSSRPLPGPSAA